MLALGVWIELMNMALNFTLQIYLKELFLIMDITFIFETVIQLFTTYEKSTAINKYEESLKKIILKNLKGRFLFEIIANLPSLITKEKNPYYNFFKLFKLFKLKHY
jgi:hypothetical protein